jgi:hypothetical protein
LFFFLVSFSGFSFRFFVCFWGCFRPAHPAETLMCKGFPLFFLLIFFFCFPLFSF